MASWALSRRVGLLFVAALVALGGVGLGHPARAAAVVEQWGVFELTLKGPSKGNPYADVRLSGRFYQERGTTEVLGFYDGGGVYRIRFMPPAPGVWHYTTVSSNAALEGISGDFTAAKPSPKNHGPVKVAGTFSFAYADGTKFKPAAAPCDPWSSLGGAGAVRAWRALSPAPINLAEVSILPASNGGTHGHGDPPPYPFEGSPGHFDLSRFNPKYFRSLEQRVLALQKLGIEADLVLFRPDSKDGWGFDRMAAPDDARYLEYVIARLSAFRNVWWSVANGYDLMASKTEVAFDQLGRLVAAEDPYHHQLSIRGRTRLFNPTRSWMTYTSLDGRSLEDAERAAQYGAAYQRPLVIEIPDERAKNVCKRSPGGGG